MTQSDFGNLDPTTESGSALATDLKGFRDGLHTSHSGNSRPSYVQAGTVWLRTVSSTLWEFYIYDGATDILLARFNPTQHSIEPNFDEEINLASDPSGTTDLGSVLATFINITGTNGITSFGTDANLFRVVRFSGALTITNNVTSLITKIGKDRHVAAGDIGIYRSDNSGNWREILFQEYAPILSTRQVLTSGTTYTTPANCRQLRIMMVAGGGGGGGGGSGSTSGTAGGDGGDTAFNGISVKGGKGGTGGNGTGNVFGGAGGASGSGSASWRSAGQGGGPGTFGPSTTTVGAPGGNGGSSALGGGGPGAGAANGIAPGYGGGGGGADTGNQDWHSGAGGGGGEYAELVIDNPAATYTYAIGPGGTAGSAARVGNPGRQGVIIVEEFYR